MKPKTRTIFAGTPEVSIQLLKKLLLNKDVEIVGILTQSDKPQGRSKKLIPSPVKEFGLEHKIETIASNTLKTIEIENRIKELQPELMIVANYSNIIPKKILDIPQHGTICFHPSLLPLYRGPTPIQSALLNNEQKTGITFFLMDEKIDHGPILYQKEIIINSQERQQELQERTFSLGGKEINNIISKHISGLITPKEQDHTKATHTKLITKSDGFVSPEMTSLEIWSKFRAYSPWPGIWTEWNNKRLKIKELSYNEGKIRIIRLQLEGKKEVSLQEFKNGYPDFDLFR